MANNPCPIHGSDNVFEDDAECPIPPPEMPKVEDSHSKVSFSTDKNGKLLINPLKTTEEQLKETTINTLPQKVEVNSQFKPVRPFSSQRLEVNAKEATNNKLKRSGNKIFFIFSLLKLFLTACTSPNESLCADSLPEECCKKKKVKQMEETLDINIPQVFEGKQETSKEVNQGECTCDSIKRY